MIFVKSSELKVGMRLARPIYNKNGVLLYERNSKLTPQGIQSVANFGIMGIFVLEPAEPVPPMTKDDIAFERFQTMEVFAIQEELKKVLSKRKVEKLQIIVADIIRNYGRLDRKINFIQSLRSAEDRIYKHSLNVAILCAIMCHKLNIPLKTQTEIISAAILHAVGKLTIDPSEANGSDEFKRKEQIAKQTGFRIIEDAMISDPNIKRMCMQSQRAMDAWHSKEPSSMKMIEGAKVLFVAEFFDEMTAMQFDNPPESEVLTVKILLEEEEYFDHDVVMALIHSINILSPGVCVELNTGEKGLVIVENHMDVLDPVILGFRSNRIYDLANKRAFSDLEIIDVMKTMDNRHVIDVDLLKEYAAPSEIPEFEEVRA
jgi:hypothetical protein